MHTILLNHPAILDRVLHLFTRIPALGNALPPILINRAANRYKKLLAGLIIEQDELHSMDVDEAFCEKKRYERALKWLVQIDEIKSTATPKYGELINTLSAIVFKLRENVFLMNLIINGELEPGDQLNDLLEDYYDGLLVQERAGEGSVSWEEVKAKLDEKHKLA